MLGLDQEGMDNFKASRQLFLLRSLYGYKGHMTETKDGLYSCDIKGFRDMMENSEQPIDSRNSGKMSIERERQLRSQGNSVFLIETLKRAGELGILDRDGHQNSSVVQRLNERLKQQSGVRAYNG